MRLRRDLWISDRMSRERKNWREGFRSEINKEMAAGEAVRLDDGASARPVIASRGIPSRLRRRRLIFRL